MTWAPHSWDLELLRRLNLLSSCLFFVPGLAGSCRRGALQWRGAQACHPCACDLHAAAAIVLFGFSHPSPGSTTLQFTSE